MRIHGLGLKIITAGAIAGILSSCSSGQIKQRQEVREKLSQSSGFFCGFVNGEAFPDIEVQLNIEIAKSCQADSPMTITNYKNPQEVVGVLYCCNIREPAAKPVKKAEAQAVTPALPSPPTTLATPEKK